MAAGNVRARGELRACSEAGLALTGAHVRPPCPGVVGLPALAQPWAWSGGRACLSPARAAHGSARGLPAALSSPRAAADITAPRIPRPDSLAKIRSIANSRSVNAASGNRAGLSVSIGRPPRIGAVKAGQNLPGVGTTGPRATPCGQGRSPSDRRTRLDHPATCPATRPQAPSNRRAEERRGTGLMVQGKLHHPVTGGKEHAGSPWRHFGARAPVSCPALPPRRSLCQTASRSAPSAMRVLESPHPRAWNPC